MSRYASLWNKRDAVEAEIVMALAQMGVEFIEAGPCDGWIFLDEWICVEIKSGNAPLTKGQSAFIAQCEALGRPYRVWRSASEAIAGVQAMREP